MRTMRTMLSGIFHHDSFNQVRDLLAVVEGPLDPFVNIFPFDDKEGIRIGRLEQIGNGLTKILFALSDQGVDPLKDRSDLIALMSMLQAGDRFTDRLRQLDDERQHEMQGGKCGGESI